MTEADGKPPGGALHPGPVLSLARRRIVGGLALATALLLAASAALAVLRIAYDHDRVFGLSRFLDVDREDNLPTWFESALFLSAAILALAIARVERLARRAAVRNWVALAAAIAVMSLDEIASLHEHLAIPARALGTLAPIHPFTWVVLGAPLAALVGVVFLQFVLRLPARTRNGILLAGALFVGGAIGCEALGGIWALGHGTANLAYASIVTVEEALEMAGAIVLVDALLGHLAGYGPLRAEVT